MTSHPGVGPTHRRGVDTPSVLNQDDRAGVPPDIMLAEEMVEQAMQTYGGRLLGFARRALDDQAAAEEVVQDTFVRAWRQADRFDASKGSLETWLFAIARNLIIDRHRHRGRRPVEVGLEGLPRESGGDTTAEAVDRALQAWQIADALADLSPAHRAAIVATHVRGHSVNEAAVQLGIAPGTVKSRVFYGMRHLRAELEERGVIR